MPFGIGLLAQGLNEVFATGLCVPLYRTMREPPTGLFANRAAQLPDYTWIATGLCVNTP